MGKNYRRVLILIGSCFLLVTVALSQRHSVQPEEGLVPNERTAIRVAEAVWEPIYGLGDLKAHQPTKAMLDGDIWFVRGSMPTRSKGGVAIAEISRIDGRILRISHGK